MVPLQRALSKLYRSATSAPALRRRTFASSPPAAADDRHAEWRASRVAPCGTHHVSDAHSTPLYAQRFACVLPYHAPGLAPAQLLRHATGAGGGDDKGAWCHIRATGEPLDAQRYQRTFGFYEDRAAVTVLPGAWRHIKPDGQPAYDRTWAWCGNFQGGCAVVRAEEGGVAPPEAPRYQHIFPDGVLLSDAMYAYAGDFREGFAVVRDAQTGLCDHIDKRGARMRRPGQLLDLDVFHKGFARARDSRGWFFIDKTGGDALSGARYAQLEPFYNGMAAAQRGGDGARVLLSDDTFAETPLSPHAVSVNEHATALHEICVGYWAPLALRMGLDAGLVGGGEQHGGDTPPQHAALRDQLRQAWQQMGLLDAASTLTPRGQLLGPGCIARDRADFWLRDMLRPWVDVAGLVDNVEEAHAPLHRAAAQALFAEPRVQRVLDSYARDDWAGLARALPLPAATLNDGDVPETLSPFRVVDIGGGQGALIRAVKAHRPCLDCVLLDLPAVVAQPAGACAAAAVRCVGVDLLADDAAQALPRAQLYILARVLHDWPDAQAVRMLRTLRRAAPPDSGARCIVVERDPTLAAAGLLSLHMGIVHGARERSAAEWRRLFQESGWEMVPDNGGTPRQHAGHAVVCVR